MTEGDIYNTVDTYSRQGRLGYVHFRNVAGKVPTYKETFIDDGDVDMLRVIGILHQNRYDGVLIPDHTPAMSCGAPWHAGMAFAMGYMRAAPSKPAAHYRHERRTPFQRPDGHDRPGHLALHQRGGPWHSRAHLLQQAGEVQGVRGRGH